MSGPSDRRPPPDDLMRSALGRAARGAGPDCLDAETLAAFYERSLDADQTADAEAHVAGCLACQEALVALARSEPKPAAAAVGRRAVWSPWRLAWAAPIVVAGLAVAVWYMQPPAVAPQLDTTVGSRGAAAEPAAPAEAERRAAEAGPPVAAAPKAAEPVAPPAAARPAPADQPATGAAAAQPAARRGAAPAKSEEKRAEPLVVAERMTALTPAAGDLAAPLVVAPGGRVVWRLGPGGVIARSDDGGATWRDQATVDGEPLAGLAPSTTVCWVAGRAGAVWRTTDGERWDKVATPAAADLIAVEATGADQAIVTAEDGRRWETVDGGRTWFGKG